MNRAEYVTCHADGSIDRDYERDTGPERPDAWEIAALRRDLADVERAERRTANTTDTTIRGAA